MELIIVAILAIFAGLAIGFLIGTRKAKVDFEKIEEKVKKEAKEEADRIINLAR